MYTGDARVRFPQAAADSAFVVDMSTLLPFDWSLVDKPAPPSFAASAEVDDFEDWDKQSSASGHSSGSGASFYEQGSHQTSVLTRAPWQKQRHEGRDEQPRKYRGGAAPVAPSYDGSRDPVVIKRWKKEVKVWVKLSAPYLPPDEQGLRLWQALKGKAQEKIYERDDEDTYSVENGVQVLVATIDSLFGQDEMIDLGDRLDQFFESSHISRKDSESVKDHIDRFETAYAKIEAIGESLSIRSRAQRLMKGMRLDKRDMREMLQLSGGWNYEELTKHLRIYSPYFQKGAQ